MQSTTTVSKTALWTGRVMSALPVLLILLGSVMKLMRHPSVLEGFARAGIPEHIRQNRGALDLQLTSQDLAELDRDFPRPSGPQPLEMI